MEDSNQRGRQSGDQKTVQSIHHATMTRNEIACVLGAETPFHGGFEQVSALRKH
jgi:hypothetical protein